MNNDGKVTIIETWVGGIVRYQVLDSNGKVVLERWESMRVRPFVKVSLSPVPWEKPDAQ